MVATASTAKFLDPSSLILGPTGPRSDSFNMSDGKILEAEVRAVLQAAGQSQRTVERTLRATEDTLVSSMKHVFGKADMQDGRDERRLALSYI